MEKDECVFIGAIFIVIFIIISVHNTQIEIMQKQIQELQDVTSK
jgi:hypothetical protein